MASPPPPVFTHPLLTGPPIENRAYQQNLAAECVKRSTLVVLPTGLGKTVIALRVLLQALDHGKVLFLAPTKPLAEQHYNFLSSVIRTPDEQYLKDKETDTPKRSARVTSKAMGRARRPGPEDDNEEPKRGDGTRNDETRSDGARSYGAAECEPLGKEPSVPMTLFTGSVPPARRQAAYGQARIIVATPQVIENDILQRRLNLRDFSLIIYDEAHRATGNYAYVFVAEMHRAAHFGQGAPSASGRQAGDSGSSVGEGRRPAAKSPAVRRGPDGPWKAYSLGMTASPGSKKEQILEVCAKLGLTHIEKRSDYDADVIRYIHPLQTHWLTVELPPQLQEVRTELTMAVQAATRKLHGWGLLPRPKLVSITMLLACGKTIEGRLHASGGHPPAYLYQARSYQAMALKLNHALEVAETQGLEQLMAYFLKLESDLHVGRPSKATRMITSSARVRRAARLARESAVEHPKLARLHRLVQTLFRANPDGKFIIFTNYRVTAELVAKKLASIEGARPVRFVGQGSRRGDKGLTQKQQKAILDAFRAGEYNLLVATSVGEEGLDIPATDGVIFYEPVPSAIRLIQRRGRTARNRPGAAYILITKDSRDEAYYWASHHKEKQMRDLLQTGFPPEELTLELPTPAELRMAAGLPSVPLEPSALVDAPAAPVPSSPANAGTPPPPGTAAPSIPAPERSIEDDPHPPDPSVPSAPGTPIPDRPQKQGQAALTDFKTAPERSATAPLQIVVDHRELASGVARELHRRGIELRTEQLEVGDYLVGELVGVERKTTEDFLGSLIEGKLFGQIRALAATFPRPLLILEGHDLFTRRQMEAEALYGALVTIASDLGVSLLNSESEVETAALLAALLARERRRSQGPRKVPLRGNKPLLNPGERQQYLVEGLPGISASMAARLLDHFGSARRLFGASEEQLLQVKGIGPRKARAIVELLELRWVAKGQKGQ